MKFIDDAVVLTPSDLAAFHQCNHRAHLDLLKERGEIQEPEYEPGEMVTMLGTSGLDHEADWLLAFRKQGREIVEIDPRHPDSVSRTIEAMRDGTDVVYQAAFEREGWRGNADFLLKVPTPSALGDWSYEPADAKFAKSGKAKYWIQVWAYAHHFGRMQGTKPEQGHVLLVDGAQESQSTADLDARYGDDLTTLYAVLDGTQPTEPWTCGLCGMCKWIGRCWSEIEASDSLDLIPGLQRRQAFKLADVGIHTVAELADFKGTVKGIGQGTLDKHRRHARLQVREEREGKPVLELLPGGADVITQLPPPSDGDLYFDLEWRMTIFGSLVYLFGTIHVDGPEPTFRAWWAHDPEAEGQILDDFVGYLLERRERFPDMHVFHYSHPEKTSLVRLAEEHGARSKDVAQLIDDGVLVDLRKVVQTSVAISQLGYGIKALEVYYMDARGDSIKDAAASMVEYERWIREGRRDNEILDAIASYNEADCASLLYLRKWLTSLA